MNLRRALRSGRCGGDNVTPLHRGRQSEELHPGRRLFVAQRGESKRRSYVFSWHSPAAPACLEFSV